MDVATPKCLILTSKESGYESGSQEATSRRNQFSAWGTAKSEHVKCVRNPCRTAVETISLFVFAGESNHSRVSERWCEKSGFGNHPQHGSPIRRTHYNMFPRSNGNLEFFQSGLRFPPGFRSLIHRRVGPQPIDSEPCCGWTKSISHHFETMVDHCLLVFFLGNHHKGAMGLRLMALGCCFLCYGV